MKHIIIISYMIPVFLTCSVPTIPNAKVLYTKTSFSNNEVVDFTCNYGYYSDNQHATCNKNNTWTYTQCKLMCKAPNNYISHNYQPLFKIGHVLNLQCGKSFTCVEKDGSVIWNDTVTCPNIKCNKLPVLENGYYSASKNEDFSFGEEITANCNNNGVVNYELIGSLYITCIDNDKWTEQPICKIKCPIPYLSNGIIIGSRYSNDDVINFKCKNSFKINGYSSSTCENGKWSNPMPKCIRNIVKHAVSYIDQEEDDIDEETDIGQNKKDITQYEEDVEILESTYNFVFVIISISCIFFIVSIIILIFSCNCGNKHKYKISYKPL
ncbi:EEV type-I membrane glycoprotein [Yokapox virus]|uniref:EEV type-I membrane glycoprotein n=1 Tax=Yokapox virus TaxID=1076255 RepID=G3EI53_9POXV|nr:EEV type-I membrane glycoprotein [Yokapox virus]AEN03750.1 EEV type-I membrane glycoprotein [Yokapox virus]